MVCPVTIVILMIIMIVRLVSATMVPTLIPILPIIILVVMAENRVTSKQQWRIPLKKNIDLGKTFFMFPLILMRFVWDLKQIPRKNDSNTPKALVKKLVMSNRKIRLLVNYFLTRSLSESNLMWTSCCNFSVVFASNPTPI